jgi:hypothetical protein
MPLLAVNEDKKEVDIEITEKVIALCDWQLKVRHLHDPVDADNVIAKLEEQIRRALKRGALSTRDLKRFANANRAGLWFFEKAMKNLEKVGEIRWDGKRKKWTA